MRVSPIVAEEFAAFLGFLLPYLGRGFPSYLRCNFPKGGAGTCYRTRYLAVMPFPEGESELWEVIETEGSIIGAPNRLGEWFS
jgi:hypothetical protein